MQIKADTRRFSPRRVESPPLEGSRVLADKRRRRACTAHIQREGAERPR